MIPDIQQIEKGTMNWHVPMNANLQAIKEGFASLDESVAPVTNATEAPAAAGQVWTATEAGAGWAELQVAGVDVIWVNASQTSSFGAQTISLDLSKYDFIRITLTASVNETLSTPYDLQVYRKINYAKHRAMNTRVEEDHLTWSCNRNVSVDFDAGSITFENATQEYNGSTSTRNDRAIPIYILGYKGA